MKITQTDRLRRELDVLTDTRNDLQQILNRRCIGKTEDITWIRMRMNAMILHIDIRIGEKKWQSTDAEIRQRLGEEEIDYDEAGMGYNGGETDGEADYRSNDPDYGGAPVCVQQERERADGKKRRRTKAGYYNSMYAVAAVKAPEPWSAEAYLRARYRERHEDALMDWQREVMEEDRQGIRGRMTI